MQEAIPKNFILLSKVAKEKKYAQEYLGLLARRGDIGSVRIGKRWYTTWVWFEEFLENGQKKKEVVREVQVASPVMVEEVKSIEYIEKKPASTEAMAGDVKINVPFVFPEREKVTAFQPAVETKREERIVEALADVEASSSPADKLAGKPEKIAVAVNPQGDQIIVRKNIAIDKVDISSSASLSRPVKLQTEKIQTRRSTAEQPRKVARPLFQTESKLNNISVAEKNRYAVPYQEIKFKKKSDIFSPDFSGEENMRAPIFSQFAFAVSFAVILLLVVASGYFVWSGGSFAKGTVAGASDERNVGFSGITSGGEYVLTSAGDKIRESLSISRVMVQAAKEKTANSEPLGGTGDAKAVLSIN